MLKDNRVRQVFKREWGAACIAATMLAPGAIGLRADEAGQQDIVDKATILGWLGLDDLSTQEHP